MARNTPPPAPGEPAAPTASDTRGPEISGPVPGHPLVGIVILNWNGWRDTIDAVTSTRELTYLNHRVYVVDNASTDDSEANLRAWAPELTIIQSGGNLGWSGGNNAGIRAASRDGCRHVLLLNNDAMMRPKSLTALIDAAERLPDAACVGSLIVDANDPEEVEFAGNTVNPRTGLPHRIHGPLGNFVNAEKPVPTVAVKGCSMLLTQTGLTRVGLLSEDYFLNFDETDWCYRARAAGLQNYMAGGSIVAHKGAVSFAGTEGPLYRYFVARNRLVFARRHLGPRGRWYAWRGALSDLREALARPPSEGTHTATRLTQGLAILLAVVDYCRGRLGDCPPRVRVWNRRS
jgi:GT2 family glycosyltransferase